MATVDALAGQLKGDGFADAPAAARDEGYLAGEAEVHVVLLFVLFS